MENKILEKLRKLISLKESATAIGSIGEANAAAAGINRLLIKYNLSLDDIPKEENTIITKTIPYKSHLVSGTWFSYLASVISKFNLCVSLVISKSKNNRYYKDTIQIVGEKINVEIVLYLIDFLSKSFYQISIEDYEIYKHNCIINKIIPKTQKIFQKSYMLGCVSGLYDKLTQEKNELNKIVDTTALVIRNGDKLNKYLEKFKITKCKYKSKAAIDANSINMGYKTGKNIIINKPIENGSKN